MLLSVSNAYAKGGACPACDLPSAPRMERRSGFRNEPRSAIVALALTIRHHVARQVARWSLPAVS